MASALAVPAQSLTVFHRGKRNDALVALTPVAIDVAGNTMVNDGRTLLVLRNSGASTRTVEFFDKNGVSAHAAENILAGKVVVFGPFCVEDFGTVLSFTASHAEVLAQPVVLDHQRLLTR